ncbi:hypothetical protein [Chromobacterium vaccinii]|uniref:hypothetical protein n=1 Tax=Chromobacterium vaccinii TaxID=1108595 RepID=UPI0011C051F8|nr:hypothetical protein [Chromobacterium vaccinii]
MESDKNNISDMMSGKSSLVLSGAVDSRTAIFSTKIEGRDVTEIQMGDKDHGSFRAVYKNAEAVDFPKGVEIGAIYPVKIDEAAISHSSLEEVVKNNLSTLLEQSESHPIGYIYGFHQVPSDSREDLLTGMRAALKEGADGKRAVVLIVGSKDLPNRPEDSIEIQSSDMECELSKYNEREALTIFTGQLPSDVNNLVMSKSQLVLAEGKGSISICQQHGVRHLILPQAGEGDSLKLMTSYHDGADDLKEASLKLYQNPEQVINKLFWDKDGSAALYDNMCSKQNLLVETLSLMK